MSEANTRAKALIMAMAARGANMQSLIEGYLAGMLAVSDDLRKQRDGLAEELAIAKRDNEILRKQRTEARRAAKVLASSPGHHEFSDEYHEALRLALNYR